MVDNYKLLVIDRDDCYLPKGWVSTVFGPKEEPSDYEKSGDLWTIVEVPCADLDKMIPALTGDDQIDFIEKQKRFRMDGVTLKKDLTQSEHLETVDVKKVTPFPIPNVLDRSQSTVWDYGPGRTYSKPQAAMDALFASQGPVAFSETHYIRGWAGTYGPELSGLILSLYRVKPTREFRLFIDVNGTDLVFYDGSAAIGFGIIGSDGSGTDHVDYVTIQDLTLADSALGQIGGSYTFVGPHPPPCFDWVIKSCKTPVAGSDRHAVIMSGLRDLLIEDCWFRVLLVSQFALARDAAGWSEPLSGTVIVRGCVLASVNDKAVFVEPGDDLLFMLVSSTVWGQSSMLEVENVVNPGALVFWNNIFWGTDPAEEIFQINEALGNIRWILSDYNRFYQQGAYFMRYTGGTIPDFATYKTVFVGHDQNSSEGDPLLADPVNGDFTLQPGSPCRGTGATIDPSGFEGNVRAEDLIDIGAYQPTVLIPVGPPIFDGVTNDGTGSSATLTITPPVDISYAQTRILYRKMSGPNNVPELTWTDGGIYIGTQGVQGTTVVSGLTDDTLYEFILHAETASGDSSEPSIARRVVISSSGLPVLNRVMNNVIATLQSIAIADGYNFDVIEVRRVRGAGYEHLKEFPGILVYNPRERKEDAYPVGAITNHATIIIEGWIRIYEDPDQEVELWKADIETAILTDRRRSGDAVTTSIKEVNRYVMEGTEPAAGVMFQVDIHYRTDFGNPYQRR